MRLVQRLPVRQVRATQPRWTEEIWIRGRHTDKESMEREVQHQKEIWERRGDDPGPKPTGTAQSLHPESIMKMTPHPAERSESTASHIVRGCKKGGKGTRKGHLSTVRTPSRKLKVRRDSLDANTAALVEAVITAEGGLWEAPKGLRREDLAARVGGQKRAGPVPRGDTQR